MNEWMNEWMNERMNEWTNENTTQYYCCYQISKQKCYFLHLQLHKENSKPEEEEKELKSS